MRWVDKDEDEACVVFLEGGTGTEIEFVSQSRVEIIFSKATVLLAAIKTPWVKGKPCRQATSGLWDFLPHLSTCQNSMEGQMHMAEMAKHRWLTEEGSGSHFQI